MAGPSVKRHVETIADLPVHPHVLDRLLRALRQAPPNLEIVAHLTFSDPGLAAAVLRETSAPAFSPQREIPDPARIVEQVGIPAIRSIVLRAGYAATVRDSDEVDPRLALFSRVALTRATCCRLVAERVGDVDPGQALVTGLLHDIGKLALEHVFSQMGDAREASPYSDAPLGQHAESVLDVHHTMAGKWLAERWRFPEDLVDVIWFHHHPTDGLEEARCPVKLIEIVRLVDALVPDDDLSGALTTPVMAIPEGLLVRLGFTGADVDDLREETEKAVHARVVSYGLDDHGEEPQLRRSLHEATFAALDAHTRAEREAAAARRELRCFHALHALSRRLRPGQSLSDTLEVITQTVRTELAISPGVCCVMDAAGENLYLQTWRGPDEAPSRMTVDLARTAMASGPDGPPIVRALQALGLGMEEQGWGGASLREIIRWEGLVATPMLAGERCYGQILFDATASGVELTEEGLSNLLTFAGACGLAAARCWAEEAKTERTEHLASALRRRGEIEARLHQAERLARVGEFAESAALAINAPLNLASAQIKWLSSRLSNPSDREALETVLGHTQNARQTIKDLLFLARPTTPKREPNLVNYALRQLLTTLRDDLERRGIRIVENYAAGLPRVLMDRRQIEHALLDLITNARGTMAEHGGVLTVQTWTAPDRKSVSIRVADSGPGYTHEQQDELFEPFSVILRRPGDTGLGLAVAREIIRLHDGAIDVESDPRHGTAFTIELPASSTVVHRREPAPQDKPACRILVADDDPNVRDVLRKMLTPRGFHVDTTEDGQRTVDFLDTHPVDLLVLDMKMPRGDGYEVLAKLRQRGNLPLVIAMTGSPRQSDADEAVRRGARSCLRKPFQVKQLLEEIDAVIGERLPSS